MNAEKKRINIFYTPFFAQSKVSAYICAVKPKNKRHMKRNILLLLALLLLALPASAKRKQVTVEELAAAIAELVDMLKTDRWTFHIDHIDSPRVGFSNLDPRLNYVYIEDHHLFLQTDKRSSFVRPNMAPRPPFFGSLHGRNQIRTAMVPVYRQVYDVIFTETALNRKGTKVIYTVTMADKNGQRTRQRITIDPLTLTASVGVYSGHIKPVEEVILMK